MTDDDISNLLEAIRNDEAKIARLTAALEQLDMDLEALAMYVPRKDLSVLKTVRGRVRKALEAT